MQINIPSEPMRIVCVLDESGSMSGSEEKVIESFNAIIKKYQELNGGEAYVSLYTFGSREEPVKLVYSNTHLMEVAEMTAADYRPYGSTPMNDAIGRAMADHADYNRVFFVVDTDGFENASREFTSQQIREMILAKTEAGWDFTFIGADLTQEQTQSMAMNLGLSASLTMTFDKSAMGYNARSAAVFGKLQSYTTASASANANAKD